MLAQHYTNINTCKVLLSLNLSVPMKESNCTSQVLVLLANLKHIKLQQGATVRRLLPGFPPCPKLSHIATAAAAAISLQMRTHV